MTWAFVKRFESQGSDHRDQDMDFKKHLGVGKETPADVLTRELIQNSLDASNDPNKPVTVKIHFTEINNQKKYFNKLIQHIDDGKFSEKNKLLMPGTEILADLDKDKVKCWIYEDFNTTGIAGNIDEEDEDEHEAFWFTHGLSIKKKKGSKGSWGLGKQTLTMSSSAKCFFGLVNRSKDKREYFMGRCILAPHKYNNNKFLNDAFFCSNATEEDDKRQIPFEDEQDIDRFKKDFGFQREKEYGTSFALPLPVDRLGDESDYKELIQSALKYWHFAFQTNKLEMLIGTTLINQENFEQRITTDLQGAEGEIIKKHLEIIEQKDNLKAENIDEKKFNGSEEVRLYKENFFSKEHVEKIREKFNNKEIVYIKLPVQINSLKDNIDHEDHINIYIQKLDEKVKIKTDCLLRNEYIIPAQTVCKDRDYAVVVHADKETSPLGDAIREMEDRHHTKLDQGLVNDIYANNNIIYSLIVNSTDRILDIIYRLESDLPEDLFNSFFSVDIPTEEREKKKDKTTKEEVEVIKKYLVPFKIKTKENGFKIIPDKEGSGSHKFPYKLDLEAAINNGSGIKQRSIKAYEKNDFDFKNKNQFSFFTSNAEYKIDLKSGNKISLTLRKKDDFEFTVKGCNQDTELVIKASNYIKNINWVKTG